MKLTAIIPTLNEESNIAEALDCVSFADEVLIIDSNSADDTVEIAKRKGATVILHPFDNFSAQKNRAIEKASGEWILLLDADERIPRKLKEEIQELLKGEPEHDAYWFFRKNYFLGKEVRFSGWQNDKVIRLFRQKNCRYNNKPVHEEIETTGTYGILNNKLEHFTSNNLDVYKSKLTHYAKLQAEELYNRNKKATAFHFLIKPAFRFFRHFILRQGFRDGKTGFTIARLQAYAVYRRYDELRKLSKKQRRHQ